MILFRGILSNVLQVPHKSFMVVFTTIILSYRRMPSLRLWSDSVLLVIVRPLTTADLFTLQLNIYVKATDRIELFNKIIDYDRLYAFPPSCCLL